ncbi:MAG TPA: VanZ family protein [Gemmataceae bacterium]|nr:VanZ family protein [Gemmataceae bacterium]
MATKDAPRVVQASWWRWGGVVLAVWVLLLAAWTVALLTPDPARFAGQVLPPQADFTLSKALHVTAYAVLAGLVGSLRPLGRYRWLLLAVLSLHGMGTEYLQQFVPTRGPSVRDVLLDHVGILLGALLTWKNWLGGR